MGKEKKIVQVVEPKVSSDVKDTTVSFARALSAPAASTRRAAVQRLCAYLQATSAPFEEINMMKLWKGLYYCMWLCDMALVQEELATTLAQLITQFRFPEDVGMYWRCFFKIMGREWFKLDYLRIDKFYNLISQMLQDAFKFCETHSWSEQYVASLADTFQTVVFNPNVFQFPVGLGHHVCDVFLRELNEADHVPQSTFHSLLEPFLSAAAHHQSEVTIKRVADEVFEHISPGYADVFGPKFQVDWAALHARILEVSQNKKLAKPNQTTLRKLEQLFSRRVTEAQELLAASTQVLQEGAEEYASAQAESDRHAKKSKKTKSQKRKHAEAEPAELVPAHAADDDEEEAPQLVVPPPDTPKEHSKKKNKAAKAKPAPEEPAHDSAPTQESSGQAQEESDGGFPASKKQGKKAKLAQKETVAVAEEAPLPLIPSGSKKAKKAVEQPSAPKPEPATASLGAPIAHQPSSTKASSKAPVAAAPPTPKLAPHASVELSISPAESPKSAPRILKVKATTTIVSPKKATQDGWLGNKVVAQSRLEVATPKSRRQSVTWGLDQSLGLFPCGISPPCCHMHTPRARGSSCLFRFSEVFPIDRRVRKATTSIGCR
eukprot:m.771327 g.771327  ORF g.771327 m.771327 type:complete len:604 (+) comp59091_c1_seq2:80-1891(+)